MNQLKVILWGQEIGRLIRKPDTRQIYFLFNPSETGSIPDIAPIAAPASRAGNRLLIYGEERFPYQGLPPFIADSLPDAWGDTLFDKWVHDNRIPNSKVTPLYKLMFIGTRGMGALEYEPAAEELAHSRNIDLGALYDISLKVLDSRAEASLNTAENLTLQALLAVGTSAGGRQMKAVIAVNRETGEIRSGQTAAPEGFDYCILKFGNDKMPVAEIEMACYAMATDASITMMRSDLLRADGTNHFLTERFDRLEGKKIHIQTLAAINPDARNYEDLVATCRELQLTEEEIEQVFLRMTFNVMCNNTDDHNKNFSFMLPQGGKWRLAPAYDMTFIFNGYATGPNQARRFGILGKTSGVTKQDLLEFARRNGIKDAQPMIDRVAKSISRFAEYAERYGISHPWRDIIGKTLNDTLVEYGYLELPTGIDAYDRYGRHLTDLAITVNSKGHYAVAATIDGDKRRRFIRPNSPIYREMQSTDLLAMTSEQKTRLAERLFPIS